MNAENIYAEWAVLVVHSPGQPPEFGGVFLLDGRDQILYFKLKEKLDTSDPTIVNIWAEMETELKQRIAEHGGVQAFAWLDTMENAFRLNQRRQILHRDERPVDLLEQLYLLEVEKGTSHRSANPI